MTTVIALGEELSTRTVRMRGAGLCCVLWLWLQVKQVWEASCASLYQAEVGHRQTEKPRLFGNKDRWTRLERLKGRKGSCPVLLVSCSCQRQSPPEGGVAWTGKLSSGKAQCQSTGTMRLDEHP